MQFSFSQSGKLNAVREQLNAQLHQASTPRGKEEDQAVRAIAHYAAVKFDARQNDWHDKANALVAQKGLPMKDALEQTEPDVSVSISASVSIS